MDRIFFSIVVVCLNPGEKLMPTIQSVLMQECGSYEIVVKDGGSVDGSLARLPKDDRIRLYVQKDKGIYDAMNQALPHVKGRYVLFLNCGDVLHDGCVLSEMEKRIGQEEAERKGTQKQYIFYGNQYNQQQKSVVYSAPQVNDFTCYRNVPCHQVCFYDAGLFLERGYDTKYRVRADYEHFLYCIYEKKVRAISVDVLVADYEGGGFSETKENRRISAREHREIAARYLGRRKALRYRLIMLLTLAPLRTRLAEDARYASLYNKVKTAVYRLKENRR